LPHANWIGTVQHGLPAGLLKPHAGSQTYLAFLGRISPEKGLDRAIQIALESGLPLRIAAKVDDSDAEYFRSVIRPLLDNDGVEFIGEIGDGEKAQFLSGALGLLLPIDWPEPFGLVMIEAMACGTPVIAFNRGSVPEIIDNGVTGFIVRDVAEAVAKLPRLASLSRPAIRQRFETRFTAQRMAADYLDIYRNLSSFRKIAAVRRSIRHTNGLETALP
jgi:glycosyltransferase involved in cell wall biosynthesis